MTSKQLIILLLILAGVGILATAGKSLVNEPAEVIPVPFDGVQECTLDAKMCPDGSYVGRVGPKCEFAACPAPVATTTTSIDNAETFSVKLGQKITDGVFVMTPTTTLEDSRCPLGVQCIQAGTVRIEVNYSFGSGPTRKDELKLGVQKNLGGRTVTLVKVDPVPQVSVPRYEGNDIFTFEVK